MIGTATEGPGYLNDHTNSDDDDLDMLTYAESVSISTTGT